jgi:hypothetical protein
MASVQGIHYEGTKPIPFSDSEATVSRLQDSAKAVEPGVTMLKGKRELVVMANFASGE